MADRVVKALMGMPETVMQGGPVADALLMPPRNPARMPTGVENFATDMTLGPLWDAAKGVGAVASGAGFGAPEVGAGIMGAIGMMSPSARMAPRVASALMAEKGAGSGGAAFRPIAQIDDELTAALKGTDWHPMDISMRTPKQLKEFGLSDNVVALAKEREASLKASRTEIAKIDSQLKKMLRGTDITPMDVALRGPEGMEKVKHLIPEAVYDEVLDLARRRHVL